MTFPTELRTERLRLRRLRVDDLDAVFAWACDPEVAHYMTFPLARDAQRDTLPYLESIQPLMNDDKEFHWGLELDGNVIGNISAVRDHGIMFGYILRRDQWGKGYMPEAGLAVIDWIVANEPPQRLWATCDVANSKSASVLMKLGMTEEGILRKWSSSPNISDEPQDARVFALA